MAGNSSSKPLLRGAFHQAAFFVAAGAGAVLVAAAPNARAAWAASVFVACLAGLFGISALYHRRNWSPRPRAWMRRADHSAIFLLIAGTYTPVCQLALAGVGAGAGLLTWVWTGAGLGVARVLFWPGAPRWLSASLYLLLGWLVVLRLPALAAALGPASFLALVAGGLFYTVGAVCYASRRPDPWPSVLGYHEVFHACTIAAALCHFAVIASLTLHAM